MIRSTHPLISAEQLLEIIDCPDLIILDSSSVKNQAGMHASTPKQKIPGSVLFNLTDDFRDHNSVFPNTFPSVEQFETECTKLGINNSSTIVVYDNLGIYFSPRVWWMFKTMGHQKVFVLNGGLPDWVEKGYKTIESYKSPRYAGNFKAHLNPFLVKNLDAILANNITQDFLVVDARSNDRFHGKVAEPRAGLRSGHIPNSINLPYTAVLEKGSFKSENELRSVFHKAGVDERPIIFSCGSGVTACIVLLAAELALKNDTSIYDGSWTEYGTLVEDNPN